MPKSILEFICIVILLLLPACSVLPTSSGTPGSVHFPVVEKADWVSSITRVCIKVEQTTTGMPGYVKPIAQELQGILNRIGLQAVVVSQPQGTSVSDCPATLDITLQLDPVAVDVSGSVVDCYLEAEAHGKATLSSGDKKPLEMALLHEYNPSGVQVITKCPESPEEAPLDSAWADAITPILSGWWGTPALVSALQSDLYQMQWAAVMQMKVMGPAAADAIPTLVEMLSSTDPQMRRAAVEALGGIGPAASAAVPEIVKAIQDADQSTRYAAVTALGDIGGSEALSALIQTLHSSESYQRHLAAQALSKLGAQAAPAVPDLVAALDDESDQVVRSVMDALANIGPQASQAIEPLLKLLEGPEESYHFWVMRALQEITGQNIDEDPAAWRKWYEAQP